MNRQHLKKELRPLMPFWVLSVLAGGMIGVKELIEGSGLEDLLVGFASYGFFGGLAVMAATAFGTELHERTLGLLLSQPYPRSRLWGEKMVALTLAILTAVLAEVALLAGIAGWYPGDEIFQAVHGLLGDSGFVVSGVFLLATACSCTFWTLAAGSTIGGVVFTVAGQFLMIVILDFLVSRILGQDQLFQDARIFPVVISGGLVYSGLFFYLGRRKFLRLEVRSSGPEGTAASKIFSWSGPWSRWLVSRPSGRVLNLVRKEVRLQKPIFQMAAVFVLCWLAILALQELRPGHNISYLFDVTTCLYAPIASLLAGCISLGEEKGLGLTASQLVLPFSAWLQWLIKLTVCAATAAVLGLGLPLLLFWTTGGFVNLTGSGLMNPNDNGIRALAILSGLMFLLGYWAITLTPNTVRGALVAIVGLIVLPACAVLGIRCAAMWFDWRASGPHGEEFALIAAAAVVSVTMLGQSLMRFPKLEQRQGKLLFYSITLAALTVLVSFWITCVG